MVGILNNGIEIFAAFVALAVLAVFVIIMSIVYQRKTIQYGGKCCTNSFGPEKILINNKEIDIDNLNFVLNKHSRLAKSGVVPLISVHEELGVTKEELETLIGG